MNQQQSPRPEAYAPQEPTSSVGGSGLLRGFMAMVLLGVVGAALGASLTEPDQSDVPPPVPRKVPVNVTSIQPVSSFQVTRSFTGTVAARRTSELGFERSAIVVSVNVDEGDLVQAGQTLAQLDTRQLLIQRERIQAQRDEALAVLEELQAGPRKQTIAAARATVEDLRAQVELQKRQFRRSSELVKDYAAPQERFDETELGLRSAEARLLSAQKQLEELEAGTRLERIAAQSAVVAQLDQQLADLEVEIGDSELVSPFNGRVGKRFVDEGTVISPAQPVVRIVETEQLEARVGISVSALESLKREQSIDVLVDGKNWPATFSRAAPELDTATRTRLVILDFDPSAVDHVVPGQIARVSIEQELATEGYWLPTSALVRSVRGLWAAYIVEVNPDGEAVVRRQDVEVLHTDGQRTLVRGTLRSGDRVITAGTHRVVPGQVVAIRS